MIAVKPGAFHRIKKNTLPTKTKKKERHKNKFPIATGMTPGQKVMYFTQKGITSKVDIKGTNTRFMFCTSKTKKSNLYICGKMKATYIVPYLETFVINTE